MTERELFLAVLDLPDQAARTRYLDGVCRDPLQRARIESLLLAHDTADSFLDSPAVKPPERPELATQDMDSAATSDDADTSEGDLPFLDKPGRPDSLGRIGHYEVLQVLGKGGFGIVFRAFDDILQRVVALKVMAPQLAVTSPARKRFLREARSSAKMRHENVVQVYEVGEQPLPYLVMEFIPGQTLQQKLDRSGPLEVFEVLRIGQQITEGLAAAHASDLIHRDIKPGNILLEGGSQKVKITDFGLARAADDASISQSGVVTGTPMFMAPEQALGRQIDQRADLFSLGSVLYQMVSGRPPFRAPSTLAVLRRVADESPRPIQQIIPETPDWLCGIIAKLHAKNPEDRFQSAREVADLLADCEAKLKSKQEVKNVLPHVKPVAAVPSGKRKWVAAAAVLFLPVIALAVMEFAGVTDLFRQPAPLAPIKPDLGAPPGVVAKKDTSGVVEKKDTNNPDADKWTFLKPIEMRSEGGATLKLEDDGSILAGGKLPPQDVYTLTFRDLPTRIEALRLEVLPHASLPNHGPGRNSNGEFCLTTVRVQLHPSVKPSVSSTLKLAGAWADNSRGIDSLVQYAIDMEDNTGWVTATGKPHFAVFKLGEPVAVTADTVLRVTLEFKHEDGQAPLGCFRLSVASDAKAVVPLSAVEQVEEVRRELKRLNPKFDGVITPAYKDDVVTGLQFLTDEVVNIAPLRALKGLTALDCRGTYPNKGKLFDLSPLKGLELERLDCSSTQVSDLRPLVGMPLTFLHFNHNPVSDLTPLEGMPLLELGCAETRVSDLSPLKGLKLQTLGAQLLSVSDLTPLQGMPLKALDLYATKGVTNLQPLKGMSLEHLNIHDLPVSDLSALKGMTSLRSLHLQGNAISDLTPLQGLKLSDLIIMDKQVSDLSPLKDMPLVRLWIYDSGATDLRPLQGMPLEEIRLAPRNITQGLEILRNMKSLKTIGIGSPNQAWPASEFWDRYDKGEFK